MRGSQGFTRLMVVISEQSSCSYVRLISALNLSYVQSAAYLVFLAFTDTQVSLTSLDVLLNTILCNILFLFADSLFKAHKQKLF